jgi:hypothetical protein
MALRDAVDRIFGGKASDSPSVVSSAAGVDSSAGAPDLAALRKAVGAGRNRATKTQVAQEDAAKQAAIAELFDNENWEEIAALYFEVRYALTGFQYFRLDERQKRVLGRSMGTCMKLLLDIDPQWVALIVFSVNMGTYITDKELAYRHFLKQEAGRAPQNGTRMEGG